MLKMDPGGGGPSGPGGPSGMGGGGPMGGGPDGPPTPPGPWYPQTAKARREYLKREKERIKKEYDFLTN